MPADYAHRLTEREVADMEEKIREIYREARDGLDGTVKAYFESFEKRDKEMRELIGSEINGKIWTEEDYRQWRLNQIGRGKRFEALRDEMAARYSDANELAIAYVNGKKPGIYAENRNYSAYTIEMSGANVSFTLFDESTVRRLIVEEPDLMPYYPPDKAHRRGIDLEWGKKQITKSVTSGILQGKSVGGIADDLQSRMEDMNRTSAIRTARTSATAAQNAGRMDAYTYAKSLGLDVRKQWLAIIDGRTRHYHAYLDGKIAETDEPFKVDGREIRYPGDPKAAGYLIYNCRCTLLPVTEYSDVEEKPDISYPEWKKRLQNNSGGGIIKETATYRTFENGDEVNDFFYYDGEERGKSNGYKQWQKSLTQYEKEAVENYADRGFYNLNRYLRKENTTLSNANRLDFMAKNIDSAISKFELKDNIRVQRGVTNDVVEDLLSKYSDSGDLSDLIGKKYVDKAYSSTTALYGNNVANEKTTVFDIDIPAGVGRGAYINQLSKYRDTEFEFIIRRDARFTIKEAKKEVIMGIPHYYIRMVMDNDE